MPIPGFAGSDGKIYCVSDSKPSFVGRWLVSEHQILRKMHRKVSNYRVACCQVSSLYLFGEKGAGASGGGADILDRLIHAVLERAFYTVSLNRVKSIF